MKVLVAHPQGQHSFRLVHALVAAGYNVTYMTTVYDRPGSLTHAFMRFIRGDDRRRAEGRRMPEFDDSYVVQRYEFLGLLSLLLFKLDRSRVWYLCYSKKSSVVSLLQIVVVLVVAACVFSLGSLIRGGDTSDAGDDSNVLVEAVTEAAQTYYVTATVIDMVPDSVEQANGETYFAGLLYILPNGLTGNYYASSESVDEVFAPYLTSYGGVGSSFIAGGYFNFGPWSLALFFVYGMFIAFLQNAAESGFREGTYGRFFACCGAFMVMSFFIRSDVRTFPRYFIWNVAPLLILQQVVNTLDHRHTMPRDVRSALEGGAGREAAS